MPYLFGLSVACFLLVLILLKKAKGRADYLLLAWIGVIVFHLLLFLMHFRGTIYQYPHLLGVGLPLPVLHGVFLYWYTTALISAQRIGADKMLLHLAPFLLLAILALPFYLLSGSEKIEVFRNEGRGFEWYIIIQDVVVLGSGLFYSTIVVVQIRKHRKRAMDKLSNINRKMLRWLEFLAAGLAIIWVLSAFFADYIIFGAVSLFVLLMGFFGIDQYPVFYSMAISNGSSSTQDETNRDGGPAKYERSRLEGDEATRVLGRLEDIMATQKPFTNPDLTLGELAERVGVSPNDLSQVINSLGGKTFYHYVNTHRIREFLRLAAHPESRKFTFAGLARECGFTSKTTFNKYFKLETGKTPSVFLAEVKNGVSN